MRTALRGSWNRAYLVRMNSSEEPEPSMASWQLPDLVLVGCVKTKRRTRSAAKDLYSSPLWRYRRAYAESLGVPWYILSALHGLLDPDRPIDAYELALTDFRAKARRAWSARVLAELKRRTPAMRGKLIEIHAGATYVDHGLEEGLRDAGAEVHRPLAGIAGIGRQQAWYREKLQAYGKADQPHSPARSYAGRMAKLIADDLYGDRLDLASRGMAPGHPLARLHARSPDRAPLAWGYRPRRTAFSHVHCRNGPGAGRHPTLEGRRAPLQGLPTEL